MNSFLLNRQLGSISPQALTNAQNHRLLQNIQSASHVQFALRPLSRPEHDAGEAPGNGQRPSLAHPAGVNSIEVDRFEGK